MPKRDGTPPPAIAADMAREARRAAAGMSRDVVASLVEIALDKGAPSNARAAAGASVLRVAGLFDKGEFGDTNKPLNERTAAELHAMADKVELLLAEMEGEREAEAEFGEENEDDGVLG